MSRHQRTKKKSSDPSIRLKIMSALSDSRWDYRTVEGIATELRIQKEMVEEFVTQNSAIRESIMKDAQGRRLYTTKKRKSKIGDIFTAFRALNSSKVGG